MPKLKFSDHQISRIKTFLELGWSYSTIQRMLKEDGLTISVGYLSKLKNAEERRPPCMRPKAIRRGKFRVFSPANVATLKRLVSDPDPPTQRDLAKRFHCSQQAVCKAVKRLDKKLVKKPKGHALTAKTIEKRRRRAWPLYRRLRCDQWRNFITTDEAWVYLSDTGRKRSVQYISRDARRSEAEVAVHVANPRGVMVWVAISARGISRPLFIEPGAKINAVYYQQKVLRPFFARDASKLYPDGQFVFHQDSAPSHKAATTIQWLESRNIKFVKPDEWMPSSPDAAPCDYFLWGHLKRLLNQKSRALLQALKKPSRGR